MCQFFWLFKAWLKGKAIGDHWGKLPLVGILCSLRNGMVDSFVEK